MDLDQTRFVQYWKNPELYRIEYLKNIVPEVNSYGLQRGSAFHILVDAWARGENSSWVLERFAEEGIQNKEAIENANVLFEIYLRDRSDYKVIMSEQEFAVELTDKHRLVGKIDQILETPMGIMVGELKTNNYKARKNYVQKEWQTKRQADTLLLGARQLGFEVSDVIPIHLVELTPPEHWELDSVYRSDHQLELTKQAFIQTCDNIESTIKQHGIDTPWTHLRESWPCNAEGKCEYELLCGIGTWDATDLAGFKTRREHLKIYREVNTNG